MTRPRLAFLVEQLGPYHVARLAAAAAAGEVELEVVEVAGRSSRYGWGEGQAAPLRRTTLFPDADYLSLAPRVLRAAVGPALDRLAPAVVCVNGWGFPEARAALAWAGRTGTPVVLLSDSQARDAPRVAWREWVKRRLVAGCAAAFVAGSRHAAYLERLGFPPGQVVQGYDVVDNAHFASLAAVARAAPPGPLAEVGLDRPHFLASARFVPQKNLAGLLDEYARYRAAAPDGWDLHLLGDGPLQAELRAQVVRLGLGPAVRFLGFEGYDRLPYHYGLARAFVLASTVEPWGLVVNEAMAAGLPVLVSEACGCAPELVRDGENGFTFDPAAPGALAAALARLTALPEAALAAFGEASRRLVAPYTPEAWAAGLARAARLALARGPCAGPFGLARWLP